MPFFRKRHHEADATPTFRVVAVGPTGCGKSIFLSTLFHQLNFPVPGRAYHLDADLEHLTALSEIYEQVCDTSRGWPLGTFRSEMHEYVFNCMASGDNEPVLRVSCLDYSGELLEGGADVARANREDLQARVGEAHAVMGMLDGQQVRALLRREVAGVRHFEATVRPMFSLLQKASCPIHLVLTKWDLVRDYGEPAGTTDKARLADVIDALWEFPHIRALIHARTAQQTVRLIPVSAVGTGFAELDATGHVVKRRDGRLQPFNVDVPLCTILPDLFEQVSTTHVEAQRADIDKEARRRLRRDTAAWLASFGIAIRRPTRIGLGFLLTPLGPAGGALTELFDTWATTSGTQVIQAHATMTARSSELESRRRDVIREFRAGVERLEQTFPNSRLNLLGGAA